jgi:hypothetical protein
MEVGLNFIIDNRKTCDITRMLVLFSRVDPELRTLSTEWGVDIDTILKQRGLGLRQQNEGR